MDVVSCFETIFPSKTLWKLNKIDSTGFIVFSSFVFGGHCLRLCHGNCKVIYLYSPFTITSLSWPNNRGNIRSSLFPLLMIRSIQPQHFRQLMHIHTCAHTQPCYWWETYGLWVRFPSSQCVFVCVVFFRLLVFLMVKEKGGDGFLFILKMLEGLKSGFRQKH